MKTIKFILNDDGSILSSSIGFQINQYSYNDTLINVYVPKELLDNMTDTETYVYSNNVTMAMYYTLANASQKLGTTYYFTPVKKADGTLRYYVDINHKQYAIFERKMPKEFTLYSGTQEYALNVISYRTNISVTPNTTEIIGIVSSATFNLDIQPSLNMATNPQEVDTDLSTLIANVNAILSALGDFQHKQDGLINVAIANGSSTYTDYVVQALNYLDLRVKENYTINGTQTGDITSLDGRVTTLENQAISGFRYIGSITSNVAPNSADLNAYATSQGITLQNGDIAIWIQTISGGTDKTYRCIWDYPNNWTWYEIPPIELASNYNAGLVQGNYGNDTTSNVLASIVGGKIVDIYFKQSDNTYASIGIKLNYIIDDINNIINGATTVKKAYYATYDSSELNQLNPLSINNKFMTKTDGATKTYVKSYALPKEFNDVYQLKLQATIDGVVENVYTIDSSIVAGASEISDATTLGDNTLPPFKLYINDIYSYQLSNKNSFKAIFKIYFDNNINDVGLILNIRYVKNGNTTQLASVTTDRFNFVGGNIYTKTISGYFNNLTSTGINITNGGYYEIELTYNTTTSASNNFHVYSDAPELCTFSLSTDAYTIVSSQSGIIVHEKTLTLDTSNGNVLIAELGNIVLLDKTQHQFILHLPIGVSWTDIPKDCYFDIQINGVSVGYAINKKFYSDGYIGNLFQFLNVTDTFNFIATSLDDGNGGMYFDIVSEDDISLYIPRNEDIEYDAIEDKYYCSTEFVDMLLNKICIVDFNTVGIVNNFPQNSLLRVKYTDNNTKTYSFDYATYDEDTQTIINYNIKLLYDNDNSKWYFECSKDGIYTQNTINSLLNGKADLTNSSQVITADKIIANEVGKTSTTYFSRSQYSSSSTEIGFTNRTTSKRSRTRYKNNNLMLSVEDTGFVDPITSYELTNTYIQEKVDLGYSYNRTVTSTDYSVNFRGDTLKITHSNNKLTYNNNEIIDTNNATTELFLTDAEMTTLISEVFD